MGAAVVWLTGLPSSGKTTIGRSVVKTLLDEGRQAVLLDADELRYRLWPELMFTKEDRDANAQRLGYVARMFAQQGVVPVIAAISPYRLSRSIVRGLTKNFIEVYVRCPIGVCIGRDVKGLYARAIAGEIKGFTGIDDPYEAPDSPEVSFDTSEESVEVCRDKILAAMREREDPL